METLYCLLIGLSSGIILLYFYFHNKNRRIERYLIKHKKEYYIILELCYFILLLSFIYNVRFVVYDFVARVSEPYIKKYI